MKLLVLRTSVTNTMSTNISPRVQKEIIGFIGENVGKYRQYIDKLNKYKNIHFFQFSKHLKQEEHQINTLPHEYGKKTDI